MAFEVEDEGEMFARFFPELEDVEIWVWQMNGVGQFASGVCRLTRDNFPSGWTVACSGPSCNGTCEPRGWVYALLHKEEDSLETGERCRGTWQGMEGWEEPWPCQLEWRVAIRLVRKEAAENRSREG